MKTFTAKPQILNNTNLFYQTYSKTSKKKPFYPEVYDAIKEFIP